MRRALLPESYIRFVPLPFDEHPISYPHTLVLIFCCFYERNTKHIPNVHHVEV